MNRKESPLLVGITGASGTILARKFISHVIANGVNCHIILSKWAQPVAVHETDQSWEDWFKENGKGVISSDWEDMSSSAASGSANFRGMIVIPCSMGTLGGIRAGISRNLIERAADVSLKEKRPLILVPRETPFNRIHMENMLALESAGATIMPPLFSFYNKPESIDDLVDQFCFRAMQHLDIDVPDLKAWDGF